MYFYYIGLVQNHFDVYTPSTKSAVYNVDINTT